jgi:cell wall-associated NlpC family hydrolase
MRIRGRARAFVVALAGLATAGVVAGALPAGAATGSLQSVQGQAATLRARIQSLQLAAEVASQRYDAAEARLGAAVHGQFAAEQTLQEARAGASASTHRLNAQVLGLYQSGGGLGLMAAVLAAGNLNDAVDRYQDAVSVLSAARSSTVSADAAVTSATTVTRQLDALTRQVTRLQEQAARAAAAVTADLRASRALLRSATAEVRRLERQQAAAAAAAAAARAQNQLGGDLGARFVTTKAPNAIAAAAVRAARTRLGDPYVWGGDGPDVFDCSGLVQWSYRQAGLLLPRTAAEQYTVGARVPLDRLEPGDLLYWAYDTADPSTIHHVAMYIGKGLMIAAPYTGTVVQVQHVYLDDGFIGATRPTVSAGVAGGG